MLTQNKFRTKLKSEITAFKPKYHKHQLSANLHEHNVKREEFIKAVRNTVEILNTCSKSLLLSSSDKNWRDKASIHLGACSNLFWDFMTLSITILVSSANLNEM